MLLRFGYLYKFVIFYFIFLLKKQKKIYLKKVSWPNFCSIIFLFLLKIGLSVGSQTNKLTQSRLINHVNEVSEHALEIFANTTAHIYCKNNCRNNCLKEISWISLEKTGKEKRLFLLHVMVLELQISQSSFFKLTPLN